MITFTKPKPGGAKALICLAGAPGTGKSWQSHMFGAAAGGKVLTINTERHGLAGVARHFDFEEYNWAEHHTDEKGITQYNPDALLDVVNQAAKLKPDVLILDCLTPFWRDAGGWLDKVGNSGIPGWKAASAEIDEHINQWYGLPCHMILTAQATEKQKWDAQRKQMVDVGWRIILREQMIEKLPTILRLIPPDLGGTRQSKRAHGFIWNKNKLNIDVPGDLVTPEFCTDLLGWYAGKSQSQVHTISTGDDNVFYVRTRANDDTKARTELTCDNSVKVFIPYGTPGLDSLPGGGDYSVRVTGAYKKVSGWDCYNASKVEVAS